MERQTKIEILVFTLLRVMFDTSTRMVYPFLAVLARGFGVDITAVSLAITLRSATGFASPFISAFSDTWGRKTGILVGVALFTASNSLIVFFPVFPVFVVSICLTYLGMYLYVSSMQAHLSDHIPYQKRGMALGIIETGWALSFILGMPLVAFLISRYGWWKPYQVLGLVGLLSFILISRILPANSPHINLDKNRTIWRSLRYVLASREALMGLGLSLCVGISNELVNLMFGVWMEDSFGLKIAALGISAAVIGLAELSGELSAGILTERLGKTHTITLGLILNGLAALALLWLGRNLSGALVCLAIFYFGYEVSVVGNFTLMSEVLPEARATLMGTNIAMFSLGRMLGAPVAPVLYQFGFHYNTIAAVLLILIALVVLNRLKVHSG